MTLSLSQKNQKNRYGVATIRRLLKIIGLFCKISSLLWGSFAKETSHMEEFTNRSHPIANAGHILMLACVYVCVCICVEGREIEREGTPRYRRKKKSKDRYSCSLSFKLQVSFAEYRLFYRALLTEICLECVSLLTHCRYWQNDTLGVSMLTHNASRDMS